MQKGPPPNSFTLWSTSHEAISYVRSCEADTNDALPTITAQEKKKAFIGICNRFDFQPYNDINRTSSAYQNTDLKEFEQLYL